MQRNGHNGRRKCHLAKFAAEQRFVPPQIDARSQRLCDMITTIIDACEFVLKEQGEPQSPYWLSLLVDEMKLRRASEHDVRAALDEDIAQFGQRSQFVKVGDGGYALRSWRMENNADD